MIKIILILPFIFKDLINFSIIFPIIFRIKDREKIITIINT